MYADDYNQLQLDRGRIHGDDLTPLVKIAQRLLGLKIDGKLGDDTRGALVAGEGPPIGEPSDQVDLIPGSWPEFDNPIEIPRNRQEIEALLGHPGPIARRSRRALRWKRANILSLRDLPGVDRWFNVHRLVEPMLREGLRRALPSGYRIARGDSWVHRYLRNDPARGLSLHAFGAAADFNPKDNKARDFPRGNAPVPWSDRWMRIWPNGVPREFVEAMESVGWTWGIWGRRGQDFADRIARVTRVDPMHFEIRDR